MELSIPCLALRKVMLQYLRNVSSAENKLKVAKRNKHF